MWTYGVTLSNSDIASKELLRSKEYPDGSSDTVTYEYNRLGQLTGVTDQMGSVRTLEYDGLGRLTQDRVTTLGSGVDGTVRRVSRSYEIRGMLEKLTSYDNAAVGSGTVINEVQYAYNSFSQLITEYQSHSGAVNTSTTPKVQYAYDNGSANEIRRNAVTYPDGTEVDYSYGSSGGMDDVLSRVAAIEEGSTMLAEYSYLGLNQMVITDYSGQPGVELTYYTSGGSGDAGDQYTGLDRFGRVVDQRWEKSGTDLERVKYGYSEASNRVWRQNTVAEGLSANQDEYYTYDGLYQISTLQRGTLNSNNTGINGTPTWEEDWSYDATGNWHGSSSGYLTKVSGTTTLDQNRTHNTVNEITDITESTGTAWPTPGHDAAGNLTSIPQPLSLGNGYTLTWDAWNRLMTVKNGSTTVATYAYDGATRRVSKNDGTNTRHYYYSDQWQVLEERLGSTTADRQYVWGILSIDDLILRDNGSTRKYALKDAMGSVTAVVNTSGTVQERYGYNGFGQPRYMTANFGTRTSSSYDWETLFDGYRYDTDTGLYQVRYRYLHPNLGRWLSRDPIGEQGFVYLVVIPQIQTIVEIVSRHLNLQLYHYVDNQPITSLDPIGLVPPGYQDPPPSLNCPPGQCPTISNDCINGCNFAYGLALAGIFAGLATCSAGCLFLTNPIAILICEGVCLAGAAIALAIADLAHAACIAGCWHCEDCNPPPDCRKGPIITFP
jgi:RHS repeat-associated protein